LPVSFQGLQIFAFGPGLREKAFGPFAFLGQLGPRGFNVLSGRLDACSLLLPLAWRGLR
jgi:hypothetical protein